MEGRSIAELFAWNDRYRQNVLNNTMASYAIPVRIQLGIDRWQIEVLGGSVAAALERIYKRQDHILRRFNQSGRRGITRQDALFMYSSQWVEWNCVREKDDPDRIYVNDMMEPWIALYMAWDHHNFVN